MKCLAKKTQYQKAENALTTEYGMWLLEYVDVAFGVTLAENYGFREKRLQRFYDGNRNGLTEMVCANMPTAMFVDKGKGRRKGDSYDLIDDGVDTTEYMIKRELRNIGFSDCDFEALSPDNKYNENAHRTQLDIMSHNVRTAWYEANARRAVRLYAAYTLNYMHDTYNYGAERLNRLYALVAPQIKSYIERFLIGNRRVDKELHEELDEMHGKLEKCGLHLEEVVKEDTVTVRRKEPPKESKNPPIHLDIGEYEKIMKEVGMVRI